MLYSLLFVATCRTVCYLLLHAIQLASCCRMPYSLLFAAAYHIQFTNLLLTPYSFLYPLPHAIQFAVGCHMPYGLLFVAAHHTVLISVAACRIICYLLPHAVQFAISCRMLYSLLFVATCRTVAI